jgi:hypothetical protein
MGLGLTLGVECPASLGSIASPEAGGFELNSLRIGIGTVPPVELAGKQARITVEVVGSNGRYAHNMKQGDADGHQRSRLKAMEGYPARP